MTETNAAADEFDVGDRLARLHDGGVFLFVSIDMTNSTEFKNHEPHWPYVMHFFYQNVVENMRKVSPRFNVWKYIGDEVTFWRHVRPEDDLAGLVRDTHRALTRVCAALDDIEHQHRIRTRNRISAKATAWLAAAEFVDGSDIGRDLRRKHKFQNRIILDTHMISVGHGDRTGEATVIDFIGPEIDIGFRISHFAHRAFLLLSAGLTYLLHQGKSRAAIAPHLRIVGYERLKGVWGGRIYPIVWYAEDWDQVRKHFHYDERFDNPLVARIAKGEVEHAETIEEILAQTGHLELVAEVHKLIGKES